MSQPEGLQSGYRQIGDPETVFTAGIGDREFWNAKRQPVNFVDPKTGLDVVNPETGEAKSGAMFYVDMKPGSLVIPVRGDSREGSTLLVPQERWTANVVEGHPTPNHYEAAGGGMVAAKSTREILETAERELAEETGHGAKRFKIIGNKERGLFPHPTLTDQNLTVIAFDAYPLKSGTSLEDSEATTIGKGEWFTWGQTDDMMLNPEGLWVPEARRHKIISSAPTVAALALTQKFLHREERAAAHERTIIDLGAYDGKVLTHPGTGEFPQAVVDPAKLFGTRSFGAQSAPQPPHEV